MATPAPYRILFALGIGSFFLSTALGLGYGVVSEHAIPMVEIEDRLPKDLRDYREFAAIKPRNPIAWVLLGNALMEAGENAEAVWAFERALALKAAPVVVNERLAALYYRQGRLEMARRQARATYAKGGQLDERLLRALGMATREP